LVIKEAHFPFTPKKAGDSWQVKMLHLLTLRTVASDALSSIAVLIGLIGGLFWLPLGQRHGRFNRGPLPDW